jgi:hypothetical protein
LEKWVRCGDGSLVDEALLMRKKEAGALLVGMKREE